MVELGQECFVLLLNLREDDPEESFFVNAIWNQFGRETDPFPAFPPCDRNVQQYLRGTALCDNKDWQLRYAAFLCGIFTVLSDFFKPSVSKPSEFANELEKRRLEVITKVIQRSEVSYLMPVKLCQSPQSLR